MDNDSARTKGGNSCHPGKYSADGSGRKSRTVSYTHLLPGVLLAGAHDLHGGHDDAGGAEAALDGGLLHKGPLDGGQAPVRLLEALHGEDTLTLGPHAQVDAGVDGRAVHQDGAGPALPHLTALLHAGEAQPLPQHVGQGLPLSLIHISCPSTISYLYILIT